MAMDRLGHGFIKFAWLTDKEQQELDTLRLPQLKKASMRGSRKGEVDPSLGRTELLDGDLRKLRWANRALVSVL